MDPAGQLTHVVAVITAGDCEPILIRLLSFGGASDQVMGSLQRTAAEQTVMVILGYNSFFFS